MIFKEEKETTVVQSEVKKEVKFTLNDVIRTPLVDELLREDHLATIELNCKNMSEEDREHLKDNAHNLERDLEDYRMAQEDLINWVLKDPEYGFILNRFK